MLKATINSGAYTSGDIPFTILTNTNQKYAISNNSVDVRVAGLTNIVGNVIATATTAGTLSLVAYADGVAIPSAIDTQTVESGNTYTFHINDIIRTIYQNAPTFTNISLRFSDACTLVGGDLIITFER